VIHCCIIHYRKEIFKSQDGQLEVVPSIQEFVIILELLLFICVAIKETWKYSYTCFFFLSYEEKNQMNFVGVSPMAIALSLGREDFIHYFIQEKSFLTLPNVPKYLHVKDDTHKTLLLLIDDWYVKGPESLKVRQKLNWVERKHFCYFVLVASLNDGYYRCRRHTNSLFFGYMLKLPFDIQYYICSLIIGEYRVKFNTELFSTWYMRFLRDECGGLHIYLSQ